MYLGNVNGFIQTGFLKFRKPGKPFPNPSPTLPQPYPQPLSNSLSNPPPSPRSQTIKTPGERTLDLRFAQAAGFFTRSLCLKSRGSSMSSSYPQQEHEENSCETQRASRMLLLFPLSVSLSPQLFAAAPSWTSE